VNVRAWRAALRIARRDALRAKGRSALVLAMIALPVLGVAGADVVYRSAELDPGEQVVRQMGRADALLQMGQRGQTALQSPDAGETSWGGTSDDPAAKKRDLTPEEKRSRDTDPAALAAALLPRGTMFVPVVNGPRASATTKDGRLGVDTAEADLSDPVWNGRLDLVGGRPPAAADEVAATRAFLDQAGLHLGDTTAFSGLAGRRFTVTGIVEDPSDLHGTTVVGRPGALVDALDKGEASGRGSWLVRLPAGASLDWPQVLELNKYGFTAASRTVMLDPPARAQVPYYVWEDAHGGGYRSLDSTALVVLGTVVGMALLEIVLLAGPAFAVGARRSRRQLGLLAAGGGDRSHIRAVVLGGGVVLGIAGAVVGVVLAVGLVAVLQPWAEETAGRRFGHFDLHPLDLLGVAAIGLVTGLLAAVVPAFQAARQDVVEALTGRGSVKPASRKLALAGLVMVGSGAALALLGTATGTVWRTAAVLGGSAVAELGMIACTPLLIGLFGRLGRHLPLSPRLALRDAVRHRGRTAPAVAAVMAAVAGAVAVGIYSASADQEQREGYHAVLPGGAVMVNTYGGQGTDGPDVAALRSAVERSVPDLGKRADLYGTTYGKGCNTPRGCGWFGVQIPKENRCPSDDPDNGARQYDLAEVQRLQREDPRCKRNESEAYFGDSPVPAGDATLLANMFDVQDPAAAQALAAGKAVVFDRKYLKDGRITLDLSMSPTEEETARDPQARPVVEHVVVDAVLVHAGTASAQAVVSPQTAQRLGLTVRPSGSVWRPAVPPSSVSEQKATAAVGKVDDRADLRVERGYQSKQTLVGLALSGFAAIVALGAAGIATGLAAADSQRDLATLAAVGASGGIRRRLSGFQCGVIAAMGTALGTVCGVVPAVALRKLAASGLSGTGDARPAVIVFPWPDMGVTLVVLPLVAVGLAMLFTRSRLVLGRRAA
jgi:putative ABC transport system permease protein